MSGHLGPLAAALVDDQLEGSTRDRALRHLAGCAGCRFDVEQQRAVKLRLDGMGEPQLPGALLERLQGMHLPVPPVAQPGPPPPPSLPPAPALPLAKGPLRGFGAGRFGTVRGGAADPSGRIGGAAMVPAPTAVRPARSRARRVLVGATSLVLLGSGAAYAAGGEAEQSGTPVRPAVDVYTVQHGTSSGTVPLHDPAVGAVTAGFGR